MDVYKLDRVDMSILDMLKENSKTKIHVIAKKLGIPQSTVHHRIKRLTENGIISKWSITPNYKLLGLTVKSFVLVYVDVTVLKRIRKTQEDIAKRLIGLENVQSVDIITGEADLLVSIRAKDMHDFQRILMENIQSIEGIVKTKTMISLSEFY